MGTLLSLALGGWGFLKRIAAWGSSHPWQLLTILGLLAAVWQTHRLHSVQTAYANYKTEVVAASKKNHDEQLALNNKLKESYHKNTGLANDLQQVETDKNNALGELYKLSHRVRFDNSGTPTSTAASGIAGPVEKPAAETLMVAVSDTDFDACTADYTYANTLYQWAQHLIADGAAKFSD